MNVAKESSPAPSLRRLPFLIRLAPQFVDRISTVLPVSASSLSEGISGLLFGVLESDFAVVQAFSPFSATSLIASKDGDALSLQKQLEQLSEASKRDPELSGLAVLGWYATRSTGGLEASDVEFHQKSFPGANEIALIVKPEQASEFTLELYCRTPDGVLSNDGHRWGRVRLSSASPVIAPVEVPMRSKIHDDFYMRAYQFADPMDQEEPSLGWKGAIASTTKRAFELLKPTRTEDKSDKQGGAREPKHTEHSSLESLRSMNRALHAGSGAAAAPAVAKIKQPEPDKSAEVVRSPQTDEDPSEVSRFRLEYVSETATKVELPISAVSETYVSKEQTLTTTPAASQHSAASTRSQALNPQAGALVTQSSSPTPVPSLALQGEASPPQYAVRKRDLPWAAMALVFALTAAGTFGVIYLRGARANGTLPSFLQALWPTPGLGLKLESEGDRVQLSWNQRNATVQTAHDALLEIGDGQDHRQVLLTAREVTDGSVLYRPNTDDVVFRLEVHGAQGRTISETMRVLGATKPPVLDVSRPRSESQANAALKPPAPKFQVQKSPQSNSRSISSRFQLDAKNTIDPARLVPVKPAKSQIAPSSPPASSRPQSKSREIVAPPAADQTASQQVASTGETRIPEASIPPSTAAPPPASSPPAASGVNGNAGEKQPASAPDTRLTARETPPSSSAIAPNQTLHQSRPEEPPSVTPAPPQNLPQHPASLANTSDSGTPPASYIPPRPAKQVMPNIKLLPAGVAEAVGEVKIQVRVDDRGRVVDARIVEGNKKISSLIKSISLSAAKQWKFQPATLRGKNIASDHTILFQFHK